MRNKKTLPLINRTAERGDRLELDERPADAESILEKLGASDLLIQGDAGGYNPYDKGMARRRDDGPE